MGLKIEFDINKTFTNKSLIEKLIKNGLENIKQDQVLQLQALKLLTPV